MPANKNLISLLACTALVFACTSGNVRHGQDQTANNLQWPDLPQQARIKYLYSVSEPADLGIRQGFWGRTWRFIQGKKQYNKLVKPMGVHVDQEGRIYVADIERKKIHVFDHENLKYHSFPKDPLPGFLSPVDITSDNQGRIYVSDSASKRVHVFIDSGKRYLQALGDEYFERPTGLATRQDGGQLLVVDTLASRITVIDTADFSVQQHVGGDGVGDAELHYPTSIAVTDDGYILVTDSLNFRIQILNSRFEFVDQFGEIGDGPGYFSRPKGVAVDSDGNVYVVDALFDNVQIFNQQGELLMALGSSGHAAGEFWLPNEIFIDSSDRIYVSDAYNARVQVFQYLGEGGQP